MAGAWPGRRRAAWRALKMTPSNKRMHATRDTSHVIVSSGLGGRVMRSVRLLLRYSPLLN